LLGSTRLIARRAGSHPGVLLTATLTALVAATLLVSATVLAPGIAENGFRQTIADAPDEGRILRASTAFDADSWAETDAGVRAVVDRQAVLSGDVTAAAWSSTFTTPDLPDGTNVVLGMLQDPQRYAELAEGAWPEAGAEPVEVAVHAAALDALGVAVGDPVTLDQLVGDTDPTAAAVVGAYQPAEPADPIWREYGAGVRPGSDNLVTLLGPVLVHPDDMVTRIQPGSTSAVWTVALGIDEVSLAESEHAITASRTLAQELAEVPTGRPGSQLSVAGESDLIERAQVAATSARAVLLVVVAMLTVLAIWALAFTARLLAARRATTTALLRARGVTERTLTRWSVLGALIPAIAVGAAAPPLAALALTPIRNTGALDDVNSMSALSRVPWLVAAAAALGWLAMLVAADLAAGRSVAGVSAEQARPPRRAAAQRAGLDVVALALGVLGLQQLRRPVGETPEIVLILAPSMIALAGTVVLVRLLPWLGRGASWVSSRARGIPAMLGAFEVSRRPLRHAAAASLVVLALAVSIFAAATQSTWNAFRSDSVDVTEPADLRVISASPDDFSQNAATFEQLRSLRTSGEHGVESVMPVVHTTNAGEVPAEIIGVDPQAAADVIRWNPRVTGASAGELLAALDAPGGIPALVSSSYADALGLTVGDTIPVSINQTDLAVDVTAVVDAVPGATQRNAVMLNGVRLDDMLRQRELDSAPVAEWWVATSDDGAAAAQAAAALPNVDTVFTHAQAAERSEDDSTATGVLTGLTAGLGFAAVFLLIGVVVHAVASFRSRASEQAVLRAVGLGGRGTVGAVAVEQGLLLGFATVVGLSLGLAVAWLAVPHTVGGLAGLPEIPPLHLILPWTVIGALGLGVAVLFVLVVLVASAGMRRVDVVQVLRAGENQ
jgi:hypothetical protein